MKVTHEKSGLRKYRIMAYSHNKTFEVETFAVKWETVICGSMLACRSTSPCRKLSRWSEKSWKPQKFCRVWYSTIDNKAARRSIIIQILNVLCRKTASFTFVIARYNIILWYKNADLATRNHAAQCPRAYRLPHALRGSPLSILSCRRDSESCRNLTLRFLIWVQQSPADSCLPNKNITYHVKIAITLKFTGIMVKVWFLTLELRRFH